jgi:hypothetical protein
MDKSRNPRGPLKRLPGVGYYARIVVIAKSKQAADPIARKLRQRRGLKVRYLKATLADIRDVYRARGFDPGTMAKADGEDFDRTSIDDDVTPFLIMIQLLGTNMGAVFDKVCDVLDESNERLIPVLVCGERVNDALRKRLKNIALGIKRGRIIGSRFLA